jgi:hypothetical protein
MPSENENIEVAVKERDSQTRLAPISELKRRRLALYSKTVSRALREGKKYLETANTKVGGTVAP